MCGISGMLSLGSAQCSQDVLRAMRDSMIHRGPDDSGEYFSWPVAFGFRRLSILDLEHGHQPMLSEDGRYAVVFNGEIYNHLDLRAELEADGIKFHTTCDTETLLYAYAKYGRDCAAKLKGMFAFAIWDSQQKELSIYRDQVGIKPIYYAEKDGIVYFASELRSLLKAPIPPDLDPEGTDEYLRFGFVHSPNTIIRNVHKLPPAHFVSFKCGAPADMTPKRYYALKVFDGSPSAMSEDEAVERLDDILNRSIKEHLLSDVPLGAFLSGGVDSSLITAIMRKHITGELKTFSIGFSGGRSGLDESGYALEVARHLGTTHYPLVLEGRTLEKMGEMLKAMDEPVADSAILPTYLLSKHAAEQVTVTLSGEGADELFGGYGRYKAGILSKKVNALPGFLRGAGAGLVHLLKKGREYQAVPFAGMRGWVYANAHSGDEAVSKVMKPSPRQGADWLSYVEKAEGFNSYLLADYRSVLADCLLMKADKATMAASLELRVPFLYPEVTEFAFTLPSEYKIRNFKSKWLLRKLAMKYLPEDIVMRRKHGFWAPWEEWVLSNPPEVSAAVERAFGHSEIFDADFIKTAFAGHSQGEARPDNGMLFRLAVLALWYAEII